MPVPQVCSAMAFDVLPQLRGWYCNGLWWQLGTLRHVACQSKMLSHSGIIGNMTTYGENIMSSVSVTASPRCKQLCCYCVFYGFRKEFLFSFRPVWVTRTLATGYMVDVRRGEPQ